MPCLLARRKAAVSSLVARFPPVILQRKTRVNDATVHVLVDASELVGLDFVAGSSQASGVPSTIDSFSSKTSAGVPSGGCRRAG